MNRKAVTDLLREQDPTLSGTITTEAFTTTLQTIGVPLSSEDMPKLLHIYDKKGEGKLNYDDLLTEQKYIHAVSIWMYLLVIPDWLYVYVFLFADSAIQIGS